MVEKPLENDVNADVLARELSHLMESPTGATAVIRWLEKNHSIAVKLASEEGWDQVGRRYTSDNRYYDAIAVYLRLYQHQLSVQTHGRVHKGLSLVRISDAFRYLGCPVHALRYLMLALCEDAITQNGSINVESSGAYGRLLLWYGFSESEIDRWALEAFSHAQEDWARYPEAILQRVNNRWLVVLPSVQEAFVYHVNSDYVRYLIERLGKSQGEALERVADYLMSCMPGCRTMRRLRTESTDYDVVCSMEGSELDFRSELGRYFVCECKDWKTSADFTTMAKFCRVLDATKAKFGIIFSRIGISGKASTSYAAREQLKVYQDRGIVIVSIDEADLKAVASGQSLISLLRERYERVRLDLTSPETPGAESLST